MERSIEMIVGIMGVQKAGGAYVPLDPTYPKQRLEFMIEDSRVKALLTQQKLIVALPRHIARVVRIDAQWSDISKKSTKDALSGVTPGNLAYMIYTSGSTGKPKGVAMAHGSLHNLFMATLKALFQQ
jgi:non-ribosomal peptide synthetase component F